jgi:phosphoribosylanthranilate isomerase
MTWVKICGITNLEDALVAVEAGADALGFVFYEKSPRYIPPEKARTIAEQLPERVERVGVNEFSESSMRSVTNIGLTALQHHVSLIRTPSQGNRQTTGWRAYCSSRPLKIFISFPAQYLLQTDEQVKSITRDFSDLRKEGPDPGSAENGVFDTFFIDSGGRNHPGGTGKPFAWTKAIPIAEGMRRGGLKLVVAGGLTPGNVAEAMSILHPWGVDVSSGVEASPGKKDRDKVRAFIKAVRDADKGNSN